MVSRGGDRKVDELIGRLETRLRVRIPKVAVKYAMEANRAYSQELASGPE